MNQTTINRTLALAGIFQAAALVQLLARQGRVDPEPFAHSINSILVIEADKTEDIYGDVSGVKLGLTLLRDKLSGEAAPLDMEMAKYVIAMAQHANKLGRRPDLLDGVSKGIDTIQEQMKFFEALDDQRDGVHPSLIEKLAELYTQTISTMAPRIIIDGEQGYLSSSVIASKIRTALFAGIRAAFLWHQLGGRRWHLLFNRRNTVEIATDILTHIQDNPRTVH